MKLPSKFKNLVSKYLLITALFILSVTTHANDDDPYNLPCGVVILFGCAEADDGSDTEILALIAVAAVGYYVFAYSSDSDPHILSRRYMDLSQGMGIRLTSYESAYDIRLLNQRYSNNFGRINNHASLASQSFNYRAEPQFNLITISSHFD